MTCLDRQVSALIWRGNHSDLCDLRGQEILGQIPKRGFVVVLVFVWKIQSRAPRSLHKCSAVERHSRPSRQSKEVHLAAKSHEAVDYPGTSAAEEEPGTTH